MSISILILSIKVDLWIEVSIDQYVCDALFSFRFKLRRDEGPHNCCRFIYSPTVIKNLIQFLTDDPAAFACYIGRERSSFLLTSATTLIFFFCSLFSIYVRISFKWSFFSFSLSFSSRSIIECLCFTGTVLEHRARNFWWKKGRPPTRQKQPIIPFFSSCCYNLQTHSHLNHLPEKFAHTFILWLDASCRDPPNAGIGLGPPRLSLLRNRNLESKRGARDVSGCKSIVILATSLWL